MAIALCNVFVLLDPFPLFDCHFHYLCLSFIVRNLTKIWKEKIEYTSLSLVNIHQVVLMAKLILFIDNYSWEF